MRDAICGIWSMKDPTALGITFRMNRVGPPRKTMTASTTASSMLMFERRWMPFSMPATAEATNAAVSTAITTTSRMVVDCSTMPLASRPPPICSAPRPRDAADPNSVAMMARMLISRPPQPFTARSPNSEVYIELNSCARPIR
ncbi:Uncharacterised protein [Mycobacteroides abscessus subsp. abscessus]|nr:Uncharacterised protein [Mycobacteroides abscessus subsp. abscessus]